jgi:hypothetical protein
MQVLIFSLFLVLINATLSADMLYSVKYQTVFELRSVMKPNANHELRRFAIIARVLSDNEM